MTSQQERGRLAKWLDAERVELITGRLKQMEDEIIRMQARIRESGNTSGTRLLNVMQQGLTQAIVAGDKLTKEKQI